MKKIVIAAALACALLASAAHAGLKWPLDVYVDDDEAFGSLGTARNSPDTSQYIGCEVHTNIYGGPDLLACSAQDRTGKSAYCTSNDEKLIRIAGSIGSASLVHFIHDGKNNCTHLIVSNHSYWQPM